MSNRYLCVVANAKESSQYLIQAGVPQGAVWSPMLFNYMFNIYHYRFVIVFLSVMLMTRLICRGRHINWLQEEINSDLDAIILWGKRWHIEFEPAKSSPLCISL